MFDKLSSRVFFEAKSKLNRQIRTTYGYWNLITTIKHPSMQGQEKLVQKTLQNPDCIRQSKKDPRVYLYYKLAGQLYACVVVEHQNGDGYIITTYLTNRIKEGVEIWTKK